MLKSEGADEHPIRVYVGGWWEQSLSLKDTIHVIDKVDGRRNETKFLSNFKGIENIFDKASTAGCHSYQKQPVCTFTCDVST